MLEAAQTPAVTGALEGFRAVAHTVRAALRLQSWLRDAPSDPAPPAFPKCELPATVGMTCAAGETRILCVGPGDWLAVSQVLSGTDLHGRFEASANARSLARVDVTHGIAVIELCGRDARQVLSKGCGLDLHRARFPSGRCARTRFAAISAVIDCVEEQRFHLYFSSSYGAYVRAWLLDSAEEFHLMQPRVQRSLAADRCDSGG